MELEDATWEPKSDSATISSAPTLRIMCYEHKYIKIVINK